MKMVPLTPPKEAFVEFSDGDRVRTQGEDFNLTVMARCYFRAEALAPENDDVAIRYVEVGARLQPHFSIRKLDTAQPCLFLTIHLRAKRALLNYKLKVPGKCAPASESDRANANRAAGRDLGFITHDEFEKSQEPMNVGEVIK